MSEEIKTGGAGDQAGGAKADKDEKNTVSYDTYSKVMDELKETQRKLKDIETTSQKSIEEKLKEQGDWKTLAEAREKTAKELEDKLNSTNNAIHDSIKLNAFQKHLGGKLKSDKYFDFVETSEIAFDPTTKKVDEASVKSVVAKFLKEHSHLVDFVDKKSGMPKNTKTDDDKAVVKKDTSTMSSKEYEAYLLDLHARGLIREE